VCEKNISKIIKLEENKFSLKNLGIFIFMVVLSIKIFTIDFSKIQVDISTILSLAISFFAIWLSVIFYFKADEASNRFYNETYKFIKDTSIMLGKIEATFGEKLSNVEKSLDRGHNSFDKEKFEELIKEKENIEKEKNDLLKEKENIKMELLNSQEKIEQFANKISDDIKEKRQIILELEKQRKQNEILEAKNKELETINTKEQDITENISREQKVFILPRILFLDFYKFMEMNGAISEIVTAIRMMDIRIIKNYFTQFIESIDGRNARLLLHRRNIINIDEDLIKCNLKIIKEIFLRNRF
jgi:hypothetical protein